MSLAIVPGHKPPPPENLSAAAKAAWQSVADKLSPERVSDVAFFLLGGLLAQHMVFADELAAEANKLLASNALADPEERKELRSVLKCHGDQSVRIADLATKLRLSSQSRYLAHSGASSKGISSHPAPWLDWELSEDEKAS
jgi:hypothetical protein